MHDDLLRVTLWDPISLSCVHINSCLRKHRFLEGSSVWTYKMTACNNTEGIKPFFFFRHLFSKPSEGINVEESPMNDLKLFLEVFIIGTEGGVCYKTCPVDSLFNPQGKVLMLPCQGIVLIFVHWSFHYNIIIWVKVFWSIILMVLFIGIIGCWCFCGAFRGCSLLSKLLKNSKDPFNKVVKSVVINFSVNYFLGNCCILSVQEYNQNSRIILTGQKCLHLIYETHPAIILILITSTEMERTPKELEVLVSGCWFRLLAVYQDLEKLFPQ